MVLQEAQGDISTGAAREFTVEPVCHVAGHRPGKIDGFYKPQVRTCNFTSWLDPRLIYHLVQ